jgi:hypothetical protein
MAVVFVALLVGAFAFTSVAAYQTDKNTNAIVASHTAELHREAALAQQLNVDKKVIAKFAATFESQSAANHVADTATLEAICSSIPGCVLPSP